MKKHHLLMMAALLLGGLPTPTLAAHNSTGWSWYSEPEAKVTPKKAKPSMTVTRTETKPKKEPPPPILTKEQTAAIKELTEWKARYAAIKAQAVLHPSAETVHALMKMNAVSIANASQMELYWRQNLLLHPELNEEATHPTERVAHQQQLKQLDKTRHDSVTAFVEEGYALFYAFKKGDIYGIEFAKQIQQFADDEGFPLLGVSMDNSTLPTIRKVRNNEGKLALSVTPQLLLFNPQTKAMTTIAAGVTTLDTLINNIHLVRTNFQEQ